MQNLNASPRYNFELTSYANSPVIVRLNKVRQQHTNGQKDVLQTAGHFSLDALLDVFARNLAILVKH